VTDLVRFHKSQMATPDAEFHTTCDKICRLTGVEKITVSRMKVSEVITFSIIGKPDNVLRAKLRLQNEIGLKVSPYSMSLM
jgi:hypothetical protein